MKCPTCSHDNSSDAQFCGVCGSPLTVATAGGSAIGTTELPMVGFGEAIGRGFSNYFTFSGRATRAEYWWFVLFTSLLGLIPLAGLVTLIPSLALGVRRLHDINRSGWWLLGLLGYVLLIPGLVMTVILIIWACARGDEGPNNYGPDPRQRYPQQTQDPT